MTAHSSVLIICCLTEAVRIMGSLFKVLAAVLTYKVLQSFHGSLEKPSRQSDSVPKHVWQEDGVTAPLWLPDFAVQDTAPCPVQGLAQHLGQPRGRAHGLAQGQHVSGTT